MESIEATMQLVGLVMLCTSVALLESLLLFGLLWRPALHRLWNAEIAGGIRPRPWSDMWRLLVGVVFVGIPAVFIGWLVWCSIDPPELSPALIVTFVVNGVGTHILMSAYITYRRSESF